MKRTKLLSIISHFKGKKIGIIGDLILDQFVFGDVERISPEAPIPVVVFDKETYKLGGAANAANNIRALGANVFLVGAVGNDNEGKMFLGEIKKSGINQHGIFTLKDRPTTFKTRIVAKGQQIVRVDRETTNDISKKTEEFVIKFISDNIKDWDGLIVSDYGKGFVTEKVAKTIVLLANKYKKPLIGDIKPAAHASYFKNIGMLTPNTQEALQISGSTTVQKAGKKIQEQLHCNVLVTQGADGMILFEGEKVIHFPALAKEVVDIVGAGDTVAAALCLSCASQASMEEGAIIASFAASIVVNKMGTAVVELDELKQSLEDEK